MSSEGHLPGFEGATGWLNSPPVTASDVRGKVVLVDFWTYTCINWLRTLSYVRAWAEKYRDRGLVTVGVHTPEFPFEQDVHNIGRAVKDMGIEYPVAIDSDYRVWRAFSNHYWPAVYLADAQGTIRHHQFGEGRYEECERVIQRLLREAGVEGVDDALVSVVPTVSRLKRIGRTWRRPRHTWATSKLRTSRRPVASRSTSLERTSRQSR